MLKIVFRESRDLGCPMSEFVQKSAREPSREPSRAIFGQLDNSARLGPRSNTPKIWTERENLSECRPLLDNLSTKTGSWSISLSEIRP